MTVEWFSLAELTERIGGLVWVEKQVGDVLVDWSKVDPAPSVAIALRIAGGHHHWHSEVLTSCLPTSPGLAPADAVKPPTSGWTATIETLRSLREPQGTAVRLRSIVKVINPWIEREIDMLIELARPVSDAAMTRWLRFASLDHDDDGGGLARLLAARSDEPVRFEDHAIVNGLDLS